MPAFPISSSIPALWRRCSPSPLCCGPGSFPRRRSAEAPGRSGASTSVPDHQLSRVHREPLLQAGPLHEPPPPALRLPAGLWRRCLPLALPQPAPYPPQRTNTRILHRQLLALASFLSPRLLFPWLQRVRPSLWVSQVLSQVQLASLASPVSPWLSRLELSRA